MSLKISENLTNSVLSSINNRNRTPSPSSPATNLVAKLPQIMQHHQHHHLQQQQTTASHPHQTAANNTSTAMVVSAKTPFSIEHILCQNLNNNNNNSSSQNNNNNPSAITNSVKSKTSAKTSGKSSNSDSNSDKLKTSFANQSLPSSEYISNNNNNNSNQSLKHPTQSSRHDHEDYQRIINRERWVIF